MILPPPLFQKGEQGVAIFE